jgi:hypothetical protein
MLKEITEALLSSPIIIDENPMISLERHMEIHKKRIEKEKIKMEEFLDDIFSK